MATGTGLGTDGSDVIHAFVQRRGPVHWTENKGWVE